MQPDHVLPLSPSVPVILGLSALLWWCIVAMATSLMAHFG